MEVLSKYRKLILCIIWLLLTAAADINIIHGMQDTAMLLAGILFILLA